jgi:uncharacterized membrane protein YkvA (DUF1232 family)
VPVDVSGDLAACACGRGLMRTLIVAAGIVVILYAIAVAVLLLAGRKTAARELAMLVPNLAILFKELLRDPRVPRGSKALLWFGAAWIASPIDLIPEFVPFLGPLDDAVVAALILRHLVRKAGSEVVAEHWRGDPATIAHLLPKTLSTAVSGDPEL